MQNRNPPQQISLPVYQQVANILRSQIVELETDRPARLSNEEDLAITHGVARGTIRQALQVLTEEGLIERTRGRGTVTVPAGIRAWRRMHKSLAIKVISSWQIEPDVPTGFYGQIYQGILLASQQVGYRVVLERMGGHFPRLKSTHQPESIEQVIGVIMIGVCEEQMIAMHTQAGYPLVCTDYWPANSLADGVVFDCFGEGVKATEYLLSLGHRQVFFVGNSIIDEDRRQRHECDADLMEAGCRRALQEAGLSLPSKRVRFCTGGDAEQAVAWFAALRPRPTAGIIFGAATLKTFTDCLPTYGLRCPDDVSLICKAMATSQEGGATSLQNDPFLLGRFAVDLILERAAGRRHVPIRMAIESSFHRGTTTRHVDS